MEWQRVRYHLATRKQQTEWNGKALSNLSAQIFQEADAEKWVRMQEIYKRKHLLVKGVRATRTWDSPIVRQTYSEWRGRRKEEKLKQRMQWNFKETLAKLSDILWENHQEDSGAFPEWTCLIPTMLFNNGLGVPNWKYCFNANYCNGFLSTEPGEISQLAPVET